MKKSLLLATVGFVILFASCNSGQKKEASKATENETEQTIIVDIHNAQNALDYQGVYQGTLPTASGSGMLVTVTLSDGMYQRAIEYIDENDKPFISKGTYTWDENKNSVITLIGADVPNQYFVAENKLYQLDIDGKRIEGDMADMYVLNKQ